MIVVRCLVLYCNFAKSRLSGGEEEMEGQEGREGNGEERAWEKEGMGRKRREGEGGEGYPLRMNILATAV